MLQIMQGFGLEFPVGNSNFYIKLDGNAMPKCRCALL